MWCEAFVHIFSLDAVLRDYLSVERFVPGRGEVNGLLCCGIAYFGYVGQLGKSLSQFMVFSIAGLFDDCAT